MESTMMKDGGAAEEEKVRRYYREVLDSQKLPSLPLIASKVLEMIQDPNVNVQKLCRVLADDAGLSGRILAISRSPHYAQRILPTTLLEAVQVLGFRTLRNVVMTNATHSLCMKGNKTSEKLWNHSLAVALAMRILCNRAGLRDRDRAFLTGLMHDAGQMILVHGAPHAYEKLGKEILAAPCPIVDKEQADFGLDHTLMGFTLLNSWNIDSQIAQAALNHHSEIQGGDDNDLAASLIVADFLCHKADLGFLIEPAAPSPAALAQCGCGDDASIGEVIEQIREAYKDESALFKPA